MVEGQLEDGPEGAPTLGHIGQLMPVNIAAIAAA
jgi:hypothetical protein